jgi:hypothetical protein
MQVEERRHAVLLLTASPFPNAIRLPQVLNPESPPISFAEPFMRAVPLLILAGCRPYCVVPEGVTLVDSSRIFSSVDYQIGCRSSSCDSPAAIHCGNTNLPTLSCRQVESNGAIRVLLCLRTCDDQ